MVHLVGMAAGLLASWYLLSGHYTFLLNTLGVVSVALVSFIAVRMAIPSRETVPLHITPRALLYVPWLAIEIIKSNIYVARVILNPKLPIMPVMARYQGHETDDLGRFVFANSVTLTPGTITTGVYGREFEIHALTQGAIDGTEEGTMDRMVSRMANRAE